MAFGDEWDCSKVHQHTAVKQKQNIHSTELHAVGDISLSQSLRLAFNSSQKNIKTGMGGESKNPAVKTATKWRFALI